MKSVKYLAVACVFASVIVGAACGQSAPPPSNDAGAASAREIAPPLTFISSSGQAKLYMTAGAESGPRLPVVVLRGTWSEMGRQYGTLCGGLMKEFYEEVVTRRLLGEKKLRLVTVESTAEEVYLQQRPEVRELIVGIAEGAGVSLAKAKCIAALVQLADLDAGCSSLGAWGEFTGGGPLVVGRNWDIGGSYADYRRYLAVTVYRPDGSPNAVADVNFIGTVSLQTGMNSSGIFLDVQNGQRSDSRILEERGMPTFQLFDYLLSSSTLAELESKLLDPSRRPMLGLIINVADAVEDRVCEWGTSEARVRRAGGLIASSNHFCEPGWLNLPEVPDSGAGDFSKERLANLLALGGAAKGKIDSRVMRDIFSTTFAKGGATFDEYTIYQVVAVPAERLLWIRTPTYSNWEAVDLKPLFTD